MPSSVTYDGWGEPAWDDGSWGTDLIVISVDGVATTSALGSVTVVIQTDINVSVTGVATTSALGTAIVRIPKTESVTNVSGQTHLNSVSVIIDMPVDVVGVEAIGHIGVVRANAWKLIDDGQVPHWQPVNDSQTPNWINIRVS